MDEHTLTGLGLGQIPQPVERRQEPCRHRCGLLERPTLRDRGKQPTVDNPDRTPTRHQTHHRLTDGQAVHPGTDLQDNPGTFHAQDPAIHDHPQP
ncbi:MULTISPECIES: hypothetical protein, partial [Streptomyces]|uniref:hypothetical protein n=1 Tax=Streptomyces lycopersici TaxID=2974589 RepID=UPI0021CFA77F